MKGTGGGDADGDGDGDDGVHWCIFQFPFTFFFESQEYSLYTVYGLFDC